MHEGLAAVYTGRELLSGPGEAGGFFLARGLNPASSALGQCGHVQVVSPPGELGPTGWVQDAHGGEGLSFPVR